MKGRQPSNAKPGGSIAAAGNVVICTGIVIAIPIYALATGMQGADLLIAGAAFVVGISMLVGFVRTLMKRRATAQEDGGAKKPENERKQR
jgi:membrane protein implicated in regulation of membrane protease activity